MKRRTFIKLLCLGAGSTISPAIFRQFLFQEAEAFSPLALLKGLVLGVELAKNVVGLAKDGYDLYEKIFPKTKIQNLTNKEQTGNVRLESFNVHNPSQPEISIDHKVTILPKAIETYTLPPLSFETPGHRVLIVRTMLNSKSSPEFRCGSFCCDTRGIRRCPSPYALPIGADCYCSGEGVGTICE